MSELQKYQPQQSHSISIFNDSGQFEHAQRIAKILCTSDLVPENYRGNISNTLVALEMANRVQASPLMVMQNLNVIQGRPSWSSSFIIAALNTCGRFSPLRFEMQDRGTQTVQYNVWQGPTGNRQKVPMKETIQNMACRVWTKDSSGERLEGPWVSMEMAVQEGWYTKSDSKWKTMPDMMLRYRAAAFFGRLYAPDVLMGMQTDDEVVDVVPFVDTRIPKPAVSRQIDAPASNPIDLINSQLAELEKETAEVAKKIASTKASNAANVPNSQVQDVTTTDETPHNSDGEEMGNDSVSDDEDLI